MNEEEFKEMRARKDIPHDDEISKDQHDNSGYSNMLGPSKAIIIVTIISFCLFAVLILYLTQPK